MEWYEIIGVGGGTLIVNKLIDMLLQWRKSRAEANVTQEQAHATSQQTTAQTYDLILAEVRENIIGPLEQRLREEITERKQLSDEIKMVRAECEKDKRAVTHELVSAQKQIAEMREEHSAEMLQANLQIQEFRGVVSTLTIERKELYSGIKIITTQMCDAGITPDWTPPDPSYYENLTPPIPNKRKESLL